MCHRQSFIKLSQNHDYVQTHCNDSNNLFHFPCRKWYSTMLIKYNYNSYSYNCKYTLVEILV